MKYFQTAIFSSILFLTGCVTPSGPDLYYWGGYEHLLLKTYSEPDSVDTGTHIERLSRDIAIADARGLRVAPGMHAHLGVMYSRNGDISNAVASLEQEKELYPESTDFIDRLLGGIGN